MSNSPENGPLPAAECRGVVKTFYEYQHRTTSARQAFIRLTKLKPIHVRRPIFTLSGLNLVVEPGESVAFIGHNGSGKSTALRLIAGVYRPTEGTVKTRGRVGAVLALGNGFHGDLTGRENVAFTGAVLGLRRSELSERFNQIVEFADIGKFMEMPVKYYSSGMKARLGFAIAVSVSPDLLILDEVLAVGDAEFSNRCLEWIQAFREGGGTILFASHDLGSLVRLCTRTVWLERGRTRMSGPTDEVIAAYTDSVSNVRLRHPSQDTRNEP